MEKLNILPVYPKFPPTFWSFKYALPFARKKAAMTPTGLATVLAMIPEDNFKIERIIDNNIEPLTDSQIKSADLIMLSAMMAQEQSANEIIKRVAYNKKRVVIGGPFPTSYPERVDSYAYQVHGEAEITLKPFLDDLLKGRLKKIYTETQVIKEKKFSGELTREGKPIIEQTPIPRWDLLRLNDYGSVAVQYSRGCPHSCEFCTIPVNYGHIMRTKTPEQITAEFDALIKAGFKKGAVFLADDNITGNKKNLRELLIKIEHWQKEHNFPFSLFTEPDISLAYPENEDLREGFRKAGINEVFIGFESSEVNVLEIMGKKHNLKMPLEEAVKTLQHSGLEITGGFIVGNDGESPEIFDNMFNFIQKAGIPIAMVGMLIAPRGTRLYDRLKSEGRIKEEIGRGINTHDLQINFIPEMGEEALINGYKNLISKLYDDKNYYERCRTLQKNLGKRKKPSRVGLSGFYSLEESIRKQLFSSHGMEYLKYIGGTLLKKPSEFPEAVARAIKFYHFKTMTKAVLEVDDYSTKTEKLYENFLSKAEKTIGKKAERMLKQAEKKYQKLHEDFRYKANDAFEGLKKKIEEYRKR